MNTLPSSFAVYNDGSEEFQIVIDYLNKTEPVILFNNSKGSYYGIAKGGFALVNKVASFYDKILTISEFKQCISQ